MTIINNFVPTCLYMESTEWWVPFVVYYDNIFLFLYIKLDFIAFNEIFTKILFY